MKGKHGQAAAVRHEVQDRDAQIKVIAIERDRLRAELIETRRQLNEYRRKLGAWSAESQRVIEARVSEKVEEIITSAAYRAGRADARESNINDWGGTASYASHLVREHGMDIEAAKARISEESDEWHRRKFTRRMKTSRVRGREVRRGVAQARVEASEES